MAPFTPWEGGRIVLLKLFSDRWPQILPSRAEYRSALVYAIGVQPFYGKGPNPLLWAGSRAARGRQHGTPNGLCYLVTFMVGLHHTRVGTLIVATIYLQLIQNRYMFRSFTVNQCSHQRCVQSVASDVEVVGYL